MIHVYIKGSPTGITESSMAFAKSYWSNIDGAELVIKGAGMRKYVEYEKPNTKRAVKNADKHKRCSSCGRKQHACIC
jgi:hypothetical protein